VESHFLITDLKQQRELLDGLISKLKQHEKLSESDLHLYDLTTKQVEKHLRTLRRSINEEIFKISRLKNPGGVRDEAKV
jgi:hypothetical protein